MSDYPIELVYRTVIKVSDYLLVLSYKYIEKHPEISLEEAMEYITEKEWEEVMNEIKEKEGI